MNKVDTLKPGFREKIQKILDLLTTQTGYEWRCTEGLRTLEYQNKLYAQGRTKPGKIVTNAKGGYSAHNYGLAADLVPFNDGKPLWNPPEWVWLTLAKDAKELDLIPGYFFKSICDKPHIEDRTWKIELEEWKLGRLQLQ